MTIELKTKKITKGLEANAKAYGFHIRETVTGGWYLCLCSKPKFGGGKGIGMKTFKSLDYAIDWLNDTATRWDSIQTKF